LNPYYARFGEALNLASAKVLATTDGDDGGASSTAPQAPYTLVRAKNVGMTALLMYARDPASISNIEEAECGFGAADMGNKGAVGLRVTWSGQAEGEEPELAKTTELTFVATHLAAMEWNLKKRNANWRSIVSGLTFSNPRSVLPADAFPTALPAPSPDRSGAGDSAPPPPPPVPLSRLPTGDSPDPSEEEEEAEPPSSDTEDAPLLPTNPVSGSEDQPPLSASTLASLHALSIYKPTAHLFVAGDLNYRISSTTPPPSADFPSFDPTSPHHYPAFLPRDQLTHERRANRTLHGLSEADIGFGPTYKFDILGKGEVGEADNRGEVEAGGEGEVVPWRFARHRWPGWCDRVLWLDVPGWVAAGKEKKEKKMDVRAYDALPVVETSDHRAVFLRVGVPVLGAEEMAPPSLEEVVEGMAEGGVVDPRVKLPVPVDVHAWERRAAARTKEVMVGWSAFVWSTREGAVLLATILALGVGSWWLWRVW
jgi:hypothetical protein